nr:hypothetical protein Iba_chr02fCG8050 [Ipomoea batatas]
MLATLRVRIIFWKKDLVSHDFQLLVPFKPVTCGLPSVINGCLFFLHSMKFLAPQFPIELDALKAGEKDIIIVWLLHIESSRLGAQRQLPVLSSTGGGGLFPSPSLFVSTPSISTEARSRKQEDDDTKMRPRVD